MHLQLAIREPGRCTLFGSSCLLEPGAEFGKDDLELGGLLGISPQVGTRFVESLHGLGEFLALAAANLARVLDRLLAARDLRADLVITSLDLTQYLALRVVLAPRPLDGCLDRALRGQRSLQRKVTLTHDHLARPGFGFHFAEPEREQFGVQLAFFLLQRLVATRGRCLPLQVPQLLLHLVAQVGQARKVLACVPDAVLRLAATLLVTGNTGSFLEERAHLVGSGLDHPRDHVLLDDRVAARAEPRAEEHLRDVLAAAARAIQEIGGCAVSRYQAAQ